LIDDEHPQVTVIEFVRGDILGPNQAQELRDQLDWFVSAGLPRNIVLDFRNARTLGSSAFGVILKFVRRMASVRVCNMGYTLHLGSALIGLDDWVKFSPSREAAIEEAVNEARQCSEETADYPVLTG